MSVRLRAGRRVIFRLLLETVGGERRARWGEVLPRRGRLPRAPTSRPTARAPTTTTWPRAPGSPSGTSPRPDRASTRSRERWTATAYEQWVAGYDVETGAAEGPAARRRATRCGSSRSWSTGRRPGRWPPRCIRRSRRRYDAAQDRAAAEIIGWVAEHATTRVGPRGRQVQVPVEQIEAAVVRHYTSRAGDPHRHLHLQINARVFAAGAWRGLHSVGVARQHRGDQRDRARRGRMRPGVPGGARRARATPSTPTTGEIAELAPYVGAFSARAAQIGRNIDRYEAEWRTRAPRRRSPGPRLRRAWDRRAWARGAARQGRPHRRRRPGRAVERGAARPRLPRPRPVGLPLVTADRRSGGSTATRWPSWCCPGSGRGGRLERRRHPRRGRAVDRRRRRSSPTPRSRRAGRGPHRPRRRTRACRCWPAPTCPSTSAP